MRKYYQAALLVTAVISLISLLIYRHEYNRLRYVLEVFNYFGKPSSGSLENCTNTFPVATRVRPTFGEPIPSWQRLEDDLYVYAAYGINKREIRAVGLGTVDSIANVQCLVFFEDEGKPILGSFRLIPIGSAMTSGRRESSRYIGYHFVCKYSSDKTPTGITFVTRSNKYLNYAPVLPVKALQRNRNPSRDGIGVCVMQSSNKPMQQLDMIGFISFHEVIGMDNFIIYDSGMPSEFSSIMRTIAHNTDSFAYSIVPWNFPYTEIDANAIREIIETDCLYRTQNDVMFSIVLSWNEYVILRYHHALLDLMSDFKRHKLAADRYRLKATTFCTQQPDNKHTDFTLTALRKTRSSVNSIAEDHHIYIQKPEVMLYNSRVYTREIGKDLLTVNQYKYCDSYKDGQGVEDPMILNFAQKVEHSSVLRNYRELSRIFKLSRLSK